MDEPPCELSTHGVRRPHGDRTATDAVALGSRSSTTIDLGGRPGDFTPPDRDKDCPQLRHDPAADRRGRAEASSPAPALGSLPRKQKRPLTASGVDTLTVLMTLDPRKLAVKRLSLGSNGEWRIIPYDKAVWFACREVGVDDLLSLGRTIQLLEPIRRTFVIRGRPKPYTNRARCRRLAHDREGAPATFEAASRCWLAVDLDSLPVPPWPEGINRPPIDPAKDHGLCVRIGTAVLPPAFQDVSCFYQLTSSAGVKPGIRIRLWFWLDQPVADGEASRWLKAYPVDIALYRTVQPHYIAAPVFSPPELDPVPVRSGFFWKDRTTVAVPDLSPPKQRPRRRSASHLPACGDAVTYRKQLCARVAAAPEGRRHDELKRAAAIGFSLAFTGRDDPDAVERALLEAVAECCSRPDDRKRKANLIAWCRTRAEANPSVPRVLR